MRPEFLKTGIHACSLAEGGDPFALLETVLRYLNARSDQPRGAAAIHIEVTTIRERPTGESLWNLSTEIGLPRHYLGTNTVYARAVGLTPMCVSGTNLCVDILNLRNELDYEAPWASSAVEVLVVGREQPEGFFRLLGEMTRDLSLDLTFAGAAAGFTAALLRAAEKEESALHPADFLWPITILPRATSAIMAPVARYARFGDYLALQVEDDLFAGHPEVYKRVASEIGLRTLYPDDGLVTAQ